MTPEDWNDVVSNYLYRITGLGPSPNNGGTKPDRPREAEASRFATALTTVAVAAAPIARNAVAVRPKTPAVRADLIDDQPLRSKLFSRDFRTWKLAQIPIRVKDPVPALRPPVDSGDFTLWADPPSQTAFYALRVLRLVSFSLTVQKESGATGIRTAGGSLSLSVTVNPSEDVGALERLRSDWTAALATAGNGLFNWKFVPLSLSGLDPGLDLPADHLKSPLRTSAGGGMVTFLQELSAVGAEAWRDALETARPASLTGICRVAAKFLAQRQSALEVRDINLVSPLNQLLGGRGPESVRVLNPQVSFEARVIVTPSAQVESVHIDWLPSQGQIPQSITSGPEGVERTFILTSAEPGNIEINWSSTVRFTPPGWPPLEERGKLSVASGDWSLLKSPGSCIREFRIVAMILDAGLRPLAAADVNPDHRVIGDLLFTASYLPVPLATAFETNSQQMLDVALPFLPGGGPKSLKLSLVAFRGGQQPGMLTRMIGPEDTLILVKVHTDAKIEVFTNSTPVAEDSLESQVLGQMARLTGI